MRDFPRLKFGGAHWPSPDAMGRRRRDATRVGAAAGLVVAALALLLTAFLARRAHGGSTRRCATSPPTAPTCRCAPG